MRPEDSPPVAAVRAGFPEDLGLGFGCTSEKETLCPGSGWSVSAMRVLAQC